MDFGRLPGSTMVLWAALAIVAAAAAAHIVIADRGHGRFAPVVTALPTCVSFVFTLVVFGFLRAHPTLQMNVAASRVFHLWALAWIALYLGSLAATVGAIVMLFVRRGRCGLSWLALSATSAGSFPLVGLNFPSV